VWGAFWFRLAWVYGRWLVDFYERAAREQELGDQFGEAENGNFDPVGARCDAQKKIGDHRGNDLQSNGVFVGAQELADVEMLFDPAEQQFNLPAALVKDRDFDGGSLAIVGDERETPTVVTLEPNASQRNRQSRVTFAGEHDLIVRDDREALTLALAQGAMPNRAQACVRFHARDEKSTAIVDLPPPTEVTIGFIEDVGGTGFDSHLPSDLDVVDGCRRDLDPVWNIGLRIVDNMHLQATNAPIPTGPSAQLPQGDGARVDQAQHLRPFAPRLSIGLLRQHRKRLRENAHGSTRIRVRQRRARQRTHAQMIVILAVGVEAGLNSTQAVDTAQLHVDQRHQMIPALE